MKRLRSRFHYIGPSQLVLVTVFALGMAGCVTNQPIPIHGYFCGPHYPDIHASSTQDEVRQLQNISPLDVIDSYCKQHDICYALAEGYMNSQTVSCDEKLLAQLTGFMNSTKKTQCHLIAYLTVTAILTTQSSGRFAATKRAVSDAQARSDPLSNVIGLALVPVATAFDFLLPFAAAGDTALGAAQAGAWELPLSFKRQVQGDAGRPSGGPTVVPGMFEKCDD